MSTLEHQFSMEDLTKLMAKMLANSWLSLQSRSNIKSFEYSKPTKTAITAMAENQTTNRKLSFYCFTSLFPYDCRYPNESGANSQNEFGKQIIS